MLSLIISVIWVCLSILSLGVKSIFMMATKSDVERASTSIQSIKDHYKGAQLGNKIFWVSSTIGLLITLACFMLGFIKVWVLIVDCVVFVLCVIMNIVLLGYLRKKSNQ